MTCKTESKTIGDHEISVTQWPATKAITMKFRLGKVFGATLAIIAGQVSDEDSTDAADAEAISKGFSVLFESNSPDDIVALLKECVIGVGCDETKITAGSFETLFSGDDLLQVYQIFIFVLKVNYANLMKGQFADQILARIQKL